MAPHTATPTPTRPPATATRTPDGLWKRFIARAGRGLQLLWRYRLGWLAGHAFLVVTHRGRRTGKERRTVLYVQRYDRRTREATVISVFGDAQWLRNIRARPALRIEIALQSYVPEQRFLTMEEIFDVEKRFRRRHRLVARAQAKLMHWPWPASDDELRALCRELRGVKFWPRDAKATGLSPTAP